MTAKKESVWGVLSNIDCSEHTEEKNGLTYLSWAWAYKILKDCKLVGIQGGARRKPNLNHPYYRDYRIMNYKASPPND